MARKSTISNNPLADVKPRPRAARAEAAEAKAERKPAEAAPKPKADDEDAGWQERARGYARWAKPARITLLAGDFGRGPAAIRPDARDGAPMLLCPNGQPLRLAESIDDVEVQAETSERRPLRFFGWTLAGGLVFGPLGAIIGALYGGAAQPVVQFAAECRDGRRFLASADLRSFQVLKAALF